MVNKVYIAQVRALLVGHAQASSSNGDSTEGEMVVRVQCMHSFNGNKRVSRPIAEDEYEVTPAEVRFKLSLPVDRSSSRGGGWFFAQAYDTAE